jgi:hypothetical protein
MAKSADHNNVCTLFKRSFDQHFRNVTAHRRAML